MESSGGTIRQQFLLPVVNRGNASVFSSALAQSAFNKIPDTYGRILSCFVVSNSFERVNGGCVFHSVPYVLCNDLGIRVGGIFTSRNPRYAEFFYLLPVHSAR